MDHELREHLTREVERNVAQGMAPAEARRVAQMQFGHLDALQEAARDERSFVWVNQLRQDLRHAGRLMLKQPGFTLVAVLTLALGLGANVTIFSLINFFFFKPLPVPDSHRLVVLSRQTEKFELAVPVAWRDFEDFRSEVKEFTDALALYFRPVHIAQTGRTPDRTWIEAVSGNYFEMLGVQPLHGRLFLPGEGTKPGADPVVVLGHDYWQTKFGGDPRVVGESLMINGHPFLVIGITRPGFTSAQWALLPSAFIPATMIPQVFPWDQGVLESRDWPAFKVMAKLAPGATLGQAQAAVDVVQRRLVPEHHSPEEEAKVTVRVLPERLSRPDPSVASVMPFAAAVFMALVLLVLLIACANVANLMFARALGRQYEMGIRSALGASRGRLTRQLLTESTVLALVAGVAGFVLSYWSGHLLQQLAPAGDIPTKPDESWDWNPVIFTLAASVLTGVVTGVIPALRASRVDVQSVLKGASLQAGQRRHWFRNSLVMAQVGFCVIVLVAGGLFLRSLRNLSLIDLGFRPEGLVIASIDPGLNGYTDERGLQLIEEAVERVQGLPRVESAGVGVTVPFGNIFGLGSVRRAADVALTGEEGTASEVQIGSNHIDREYLRTMGVRVLRGRGFGREDTPASRKVVVINQTLARRLWPNGDALGEQIVINGDGVLREVIGVVGDGRYIMLNEQPRPYAFVPLTQMYKGPTVLHVRAATGVDPSTLVTSVRRVLQELDPNLPIFDVRTMEEHLRTSVFGYMPLRMGAALAGVQGGLGLFLAVMGIYGVVAYSVTQRTREIGVRVALGAGPRDVLRLVVRGGLRLTVAGLAAGVIVSLGLSHVLAGLLYGLNPLDGVVFGGVVMLLLTVSLLACYLPARRALRVDPMIALRAE
jgi:putative ABC transport system permease protein